jgi:hypothetical protein
MLMTAVFCVHAQRPRLTHIARGETLLKMKVMQHIELANVKYRMFLSAIISAIKKATPKDSLSNLKTFAIRYVHI